MFFGMTNSPATFQTMMNNIFWDLIAEGIIVVYLDDILIFTRMEEEHAKAIRRVLQVLQEHKLFLRLEKCEFCKERIEYLGLVISENKFPWIQSRSRESTSGPLQKTKWTSRLSWASSTSTEGSSGISLLKLDPSST